MNYWKQEEIHKLRTGIFRSLEEDDSDDFDIDELVDIIQDNWDYLKRDLGINFKEIYGCGAWGCAFATRNPHITAKFTSDPDEIRYYELQKKFENPLFPKVFLLEKIEDDLHLKHDWLEYNWYIVLREAVYPISPDLWGDPAVEAALQDLAQQGISLHDVRIENAGISVIDERPVLFDGQYLG